ncbi:MAG TPA: TlpA disulfide reductase family protein [Burkholderiaceae bacterium]|jgi:peroxiredoxin|nr:TlpA disulfide reductase family protein [Burkholderiaceae bacterium]
MTQTSPRASRRPWLVPLAVVVVALLGWFGYQAFAPRNDAPAATFTLLSGQKLATKDLAGKVYMVNFWATSCVTCVKEMPQMVETYKKYKDQGLEFIAVAMSYDPPMYVANFTETRALPFHVALDSDGTAAKAFGQVQLTPTTFVVDKQGRILKRYIGEPEWDALHKLLETALTRAA